MLDTLGLERAVIVQPSIYGTDNRVTEQAVRALGPRGRGVAVVDPGIGSRKLAVLHDAGFRGVRFNLLYAGGLAIDAVETVAAKIAPLGWHLQFLFDVRDLPDVASRLRALPTEIVFDHMGHMSVARGGAHPGFRALLSLLADGACWVKLSGAYRITETGAPFADTTPFARALLAANPEQLVWGTDWPHPGLKSDMPDDGDLLDLLDGSLPDAATRKAVLADNPARLYGFDN